MNPPCRVRAAAASPLPGVERRERTGTRAVPDPGWRVVVWNDPVNLMSYVVHVFRLVLGFDKGTATRHMLEVHQQGRSCVAQEHREKAELYWMRLQQHGLKATLEQADDGG
jgi:ATP-dependent Clp protease adaptor protein ClpS